MITILFYIYGVIIGSFLNVVILRLPKGGKLSGRSHCVNCGRVLTAYELIPVISYLALGARCKGCKNKISPRYAIIEIITGTLFALSWIAISPTSLADFIDLARILFIVCILLIVFVIDFEHYLILDKVVLPAAIVVFGFNIALDIAGNIALGSLQSSAVSGLIGAASIGGICLAIWAISKGKWIGFGDVKFMLFVGQVLGFPLAILGFFMSFILGSILAVPLLLIGAKKLKSKLPLGTFLTSSTVITIFYGDRILAWYLAFLGF